MSGPSVAAIAAIGAIVGDNLQRDSLRCISSSADLGVWTADGERKRFFFKIGTASAAARLNAEAASLKELAAAGAPVPEILGQGQVGHEHFLILEYLDLRPLNRASGAVLGRVLAVLHGTRSELFGAVYDNFIGATPQDNSPHPTWPHFFARRRLQPQFELAKINGLERETLQAGERLMEAIGGFFVGYAPPPSLLHGDLWGGNAAATSDGAPMIFDPACYYGDREADIAMTELFGGFPDSFYAAYREAAPLDAGYETRKVLYNLYHVLNHFNLFGDAYRAQVRRMIARLTADLRR